MESYPLAVPTLSGEGNAHLAVVIWLLTAAAIWPDMSYDPTTISVLRRALDEVLLDARFHRTTASALEIAEHLLALAKAGERDLERLKSSAFRKLAGDGARDQAA